ncbi:MAG: hypothetical protein KDA61_08765 [Planctomycetales bacterium]|nr:hypothetical protein [Planctomycetales bacterium]
MEQATYLEWLNSAYENEFQTDNPTGKSCQDCHMSRDYRDENLGVDLASLATRIAAIQDETYPEAENLAELRDLTVKARPEGFARHNFRGLNLFLVEMFNQFDDILGVRKFDFMTGSMRDIEHAKADFLRQARNDVADVSISTHWTDAGVLEADVTIVNKVGHRFPSGVGFRRAVLAVEVVETGTDGAADRIVWASGRVNEAGVLVDERGEPLPSEFFETNAEGKQVYQPHYEVITSPSQVQIYETLLWSAKHKFTTSFLHGCSVVKDNRLLPRGWKKEGPNPALTGHFLEATWPKGRATQDPRYGDSSGSDHVQYRMTLPEGIERDRVMVKAELFYQAIPPYFLKQIFDASPKGNAAQRLHFLCGNANLDGTPIENWKLPVARDEATPK